MDAVRWRRVRAVFEEAVELPEPERAAFLARECAEPELRAEVEGMLAAEDGETSFLLHPEEESERDAPRAPRATDSALLALPDPRGKRVADHELVRLLATGGMGSVYEAVQDHPRRRVALKMLRPGLAGEEYLERFRREVQVLALLSHPGIAQIHAAGVFEEESASGLLALPWFAMELVEDGVDLLEHARARKLGTRARIDLFLAVCAAVQHGHQKGVIHRDLKPSNVLVGADGRPKVIDFGIALATREEEGGDPTRRTQAGQVLGTVRYMSPEQLSGAPDEVDTRTDVYALGTILYELLCGRPPFDLDGLPLTAIARVIREDAPRAPTSARPDLPRELGWIALRCLEKEPARRYSTVAELAADLERFLAHEPVAAGPPTTAYRVRKFVRRNRGAVLAAGAILILIVVGLVGTSLGLAERGRLLGVSEARRAEAEDQRREADRQRREAEREAAKHRAVHAFVTDMLESANPWRVGARDVRMADVLDDTAAGIGDRFAGLPEVESTLRATLGASYQGLGLLPEAEEQLREALALAAGSDDRADPERLATMRELVGVLSTESRLDEAEELASEAVRLASEAGDELELELARSRRTLGQTRMFRGRYEAAEEDLLAALDELQASYRAQLAELGADPAGPVPAAASPIVAEGFAVEAVLAHCLIEQQRFEEAEELTRESLARLEASPERDLTAEIPLALHRAAALVRLGRPDEAAPFLEELHAEAERIFGPDHTETAKVLVRLAALKEQQGRLAEAEELNRRLIDLYSKATGPESGTTLRVRFNLSIVLDRQGRVDESTDELLATAAAQTRTLGRGHPDTLRSLSYLARQAVRDGRWDAAEPLASDFVAAASTSSGQGLAMVLDDFRDVLATMVHRGHAQMALPLLEETIAIEARLLGARDARVLRTRSTLARALRATGRAAEAVDLLRDDLPAYRETLAPDDPLVVGVLMELSASLLELGRWAEAESPTREALEHASRAPGTDEANALTLARNLGWVLVKLGRLDEAREVVAAELDAAGEPSDEASRAAALLHDLLAGLYLDVDDDPAAAEPHLAAAVALMRRYYGGEHPDVERARANHAACLARMEE